MPQGARLQVSIVDQGYTKPLSDQTKDTLRLLLAEPAFTSAIKEVAEYECNILLQYMAGELAERKIDDAIGYQASIDAWMNLLRRLEGHVTKAEKEIATGLRRSAA